MYTPQMHESEGGASDRINQFADADLYLATVPEVVMLGTDSACSHGMLWVEGTYLGVDRSCGLLLSGEADESVAYPARSFIRGSAVCRQLYVSCKLKNTYHPLMPSHARWRLQPYRAFRSNE